MGKLFYPDAEVWRIDVGDKGVDCLNRQSRIVLVKTRSGVRG